MGRSMLSLSILAALALLSTWFLSNVESGLRKNTLQNNDIPNLHMDDFLATRMNEQGIRQYTVAAPYLIQLAADQGTHIESPTIDVFLNGQVLEWRISAGSGWISPDNDLSQLKDDITATRSAAAGRQPMVITTRSLSFRPDDDLVQTTAAARLETPGGIVDTTGLKAYLHTEELELLNRVRGTYEPPTP